MHDAEVSSHRFDEMSGPAAWEILRQWTHVNSLERFRPPPVEVARYQAIPWVGGEYFMYTAEWTCCLYDCDFPQANMAQDSFIDVWYRLCR